MYLIDQRTKKIMEECKERAQDAGLRFDSDTLEYIVTNRDMLELSPKVMIPTLYDYWVHDVEVLKEIGKYKISPANPYETVINSRPAISFYNDNNPNWLNIMIFYHVLAHIDFFQNNKLFERTWHDDFVGQALADKRLINQLRTEQGRWVDYVIEFSRGINNLNGYFPELFYTNLNEEMVLPTRLDFYFGDFLQNIVKVPESEIYKEVARYNTLLVENENIAENIFFSELKNKYPEFQAKYALHLHKIEDKPKYKQLDIMEFIRDNSPFLRKEANHWMKSVMTIVRNTAIYFEPQIRTKIINEGWASYWHDTLFRQDERIKGHEIEYARINAYVTSVSRAGLNPYAIGLRLVQYVEDLANKGKMDYRFQQILNGEKRENYNQNTNKGREAIFALRRNFSDFMLVKTFTDQDFVDEHDLFVLGRKLDPQRQVYQYYIKSRKAEDYQKMLIDSLYHPPHIMVDMEATDDDNIRLIHHFEGKELIRDFIGNTMLGIEFLWGGSVELDTYELFPNKNGSYSARKVRYLMEDKQLRKMHL
jgi:stage V sporulation protein R